MEGLCGWTWMDGWMDGWMHAYLNVLQNPEILFEDVCHSAVCVKGAIPHTKFLILGILIVLRALQISLLLLTLIMLPGKLYSYITILLYDHMAILLYYYVCCHITILLYDFITI